MTGKQTQTSPPEHALCLRPAAACLQDAAVRSAVGEGLALRPLGAHQRAAAVGKARVDVHRRGALYHTDTHARALLLRD